MAGEPHHYVSILLSPGRSRVLIWERPDGLDISNGLAIAHDVQREI